MYLLKQSNSVYYLRVCSPKLLLDIGYPFDIKVSLLTKDRATATATATALLRNLHVSAIIKQSLLEQDPLIVQNPLLFHQFKRGFNIHVEQLRQNAFQHSDYSILAVKLTGQVFIHSLDHIRVTQFVHSRKLFYASYILITILS